MHKKYWTATSVMILALGACDSAIAPAPAASPSSCTPAMEREGTCVRTYRDSEGNQPVQP